MTDSVRQSQKVIETRKVDEIRKMSSDESQDNFSVKFAVLIGLIEVQQVSHREVLNTILHLVSLLCCVALTIFNKSWIRRKISKLGSLCQPFRLFINLLHNLRRIFKLDLLENVCHRFNYPFFIVLLCKNWIFLLNFHKTCPQIFTFFVGEKNFHF